MPKVLSKSLVLLFHLIGIVLLVYFVQPFSSWYLSAVPAHGVDLYNSVTHATYYLEHFSLPFNSFRDFWYSGYTVMQDFPQLSYYAMVPFVAYLGGPIGVEVFALVSLGLLLIFSYLLFYELSKNFGLSLFLAVLILLSVNTYGSLTWAGSIPYFASQAFFPLGLLFGVMYLKKPQIKYLCLMMLVSGIGILIHPMAMVAYLIPSLLLLIIAGGIGGRFGLLRIIKHFFLFIAGFILTSFTYTYNFFYAIFIDRIVPPVIQSLKSGEAGSITPGAQAIVDFYKGQISKIYTDTDERMFYVLGIVFVLFIAGLVIARKRKLALFVFPILFIAAYTALHPVLNLAGVVIFFKHDPYRAFWQIPITLGALAAAMWGFFQTGLSERMGSKLKFIFLPIVGISAVIFVLLAFSAFMASMGSAIDRVDKNSDTSSAFPEILSMKLKKEDQEDLKGKLLPSFIDPNDKNKRFYESDATVNIWWNSFYDVPLARGYIDPPIGTARRSGFFLLDISISNDTIVRDFKFPKDLAKNFAYFFTDWYGVYYFEGGHVSPASNAPPSSYLLKDDFFDKKEIVTVNGAILRNETVSGRPEARMDLTQSLIYYRVNEKYTSPILYGSNAPAVAVFSDDASFEQVWRGLAMENINSRYLIPVQAGKFIDDFKASDLGHFDAIILHNYSYHNKNKAFKMLSDYVQKGGKIFIDTGGEVADSNSDALAALFPFDKSERKEIGRDWDLEQVPDELIDGIDFGLFGEPIFNDNPWKFSYPKEDSSLRDGAKVVLKNHGKPVFITREYGNGKVIWSGMNLLYHINQNPIAEEGKFFKNIITELVVLGDGQIVAAEAVWNSSERVQAKIISRPKGILFKEEFYKGWSAKDAKSDDQKIYKAGPTFPGFIYLPLKKNNASTTDVLFSYNGDPVYWIVAFVNIIAVILVLELIIFDGKIIGVRVHGVYHKTRRRVGSWWRKEDEE